MRRLGAAIFYFGIRDFLRRRVILLAVAQPVLKSSARNSTSGTKYLPQ
jgi:hypothetical protein